MNWAQAKDITTNIQNVLSSSAIFVGGIWVYYRFIMFRTLKPRLEFSIKLERFATEHNIVVLIVRARICNKGNIKVDLMKDGRSTCHLRCGLIETAQSSANIVSVISRSRKQLEPIDDIFDSHTGIEPNETIDDVRMITMPSRDLDAIQIEVEIFGYYRTFLRKPLRRYSAATAVQLTGDATISSFTSEDEQEESEEWEERVAAIKTLRNKLQAKLESLNLTEDYKKELIKLIELATSLISDLSHEQPTRGDLLKKSDDLIDNLKRVLDKFES